jgi:hypothetical protein
MRIIFSFLVLILSVSATGQSYSEVVSGLKIYKLDDRVAQYSSSGYVEGYRYPTFSAFVQAVENKEIYDNVAVLLGIYDPDCKNPQSMAEITTNGFKFRNVYTAVSAMPKSFAAKYLSIRDLLIPKRNITHTLIDDIVTNSVYSINCNKSIAEEVIANKENVYLLLILKPEIYVGYNEIKGYHIYNCAKLVNMYLVNPQADKIILNLNSCVRKLAPNEKSQIISGLNQQYLREQQQRANSKPLKPLHKRICTFCNGTGKRNGFSCGSCNGKGYENVYF